MRPFESPLSRPLLAAIAGLTAVVFCADFFTPLGIAVWVFYLLPVLLCVYARRPDLPIVVAGAAAVLIAIASLTDAPGVSRTVAFTNRALGVTVIVAAAVLVRQIVQARLAGAREDWLRRMHTTLLDRLQGDLAVAEVGERVLAAL